MCCLSITASVTGRFLIDSQVRLIGSILFPRLCKIEIKVIWVFTEEKDCNDKVKVSGI